MKVISKSFDSLDQFAQAIKELPEHYSNAYTAQVGSPWSEGRPNHNANRLINGDNGAYNDRVMAAIDKMREAGLFSSGVPMPVNNYFGSRPNISAYLADSPKAMRRRVHGENMAINTPITICVDVNVSSSIGHNEIINKGIAITALVMAMKLIRPVNLMILSNGTKGSICYSVCVDVPTNNLNVNQVMFALCSPGYARAMGITYRNYMSNMNISSGSGIVVTDTEIKEIKEHYGIKGDHLYIKGGISTDGLMLTDPVTWVKKQIEAHKERVMV